MGSAAMAMAVAVMLIILGTVLRGAKAQSDAECLSLDVAPVSDANAVVQQLLLTAGQCCQTSNFCTVVLKIGGAAATVCGKPGYCPNCKYVGEGLQLVVAQCAQNGAVVGVCSPDVDGEQLIYITSSTNHP